MPEAGTGWAEIYLLILLPFPFLTAAVVLYAVALRRRLDARLDTLSALDDQRDAQEKCISQYKEHLEASYSAHDKLTREFHHRVKNSLQIIQSYLTLSRRKKPEVHNVYIAEAEAKVQVISAAYRHALSEGTMAPIDVRTFVVDIVEGTQAMLCGPFTKISALIEPDGKITLDRAIPLGLAIVEAITAALGTETVMQITILIRKAEDSEAALMIVIDDIFASVTLPTRLMAGLQAQLGARAVNCTEEEILHWCFPLKPD